LLIAVSLNLWAFSGSIPRRGRRPPAPILPRPGPAGKREPARAAGLDADVLKARIVSAIESLAPGR
jgi:hypothetical protein